MNYLTEDIAQGLKKARKSQGISQRALSERTGIPQSQISKIENNAVDLRLTSLITLARALDLEVELIPRQALTAVHAILQTFADPSSTQGARNSQEESPRSAYHLQDEEDEDEDEGIYRQDD